VNTTEVRDIQSIQTYQVKVEDYGLLEFTVSTSISARHMENDQWVQLDAEVIDALAYLWRRILADERKNH
jgi:hypothetical protein